MLMNFTADNGIRVIVSDNIEGDEFYGDTANLYVSVPVEIADSVWTLADFLKTGPYTMPAKNGRFAASFKDINVQDMEDAISHMAYWHNR